MDSESPNDFLKSKRTEHRIRAENLAFDIDVWYPKVKKFTFNSIFLPLSISEALAIREFHNCTWRNARKKGLKCSELLVLEELSRRIDHEIKTKFTTHGGGAFMRLCGRSPKDGDPLNQSIAIDTYDKECIKLGITPDYLKSKNECSSASISRAKEGNLKMVAIGRATPSWLKVKSGEDAMNLLLTSERVYADMIDWLNFGEPEQIVLREWEPELTTEYEFRAFIHNNQMTAISQYDHYTAYPTLDQEKSDIKKAILASWRELHSSVGESTYVADFAYLPSTKRAKLVELSPFLDVTGPALFHWKRDDELLRGKHLRRQQLNREQEQQDNFGKGEESLPSKDILKEEQINGETNARGEDDGGGDFDEDDDDDIIGYVNVPPPLGTELPKVSNTEIIDGIENGDDDDDGIEFRILLKGHVQASELVESNWEQRWRRTSPTTSTSHQSDQTPDHNQEGFWDLLPNSQDLALHPKTKNKRIFVHKISSFIAMIYFSMIIQLFSPLHSFLKVKLYEWIAFLQERRSLKLELIKEKSKKLKEKLMKKQEDNTNVNSNFSDNDDDDDDEKEEYSKKCQMENEEDSCSLILFSMLKKYYIDFDMLEVILINSFEGLYSLQIFEGVYLFITSLWSFNKFIFELDFLKQNLPESFYYSFQQLIFMFEYFVSIFIFEFNKYKGPPLNHKLFVYGTLKHKFQWNQKYLGEHSGAKLIGRAQSVNPLSLFVGDSGVPYLLFDNDTDKKTCCGQSDSSDVRAVAIDESVHHKNIIQGELWLVSDETLSGLDDYEGVNKGYYIRREEFVELMNEEQRQQVGVRREGMDNTEDGKEVSYLKNAPTASTEVTPSIIKAHVYGLVEMPCNLSKQKLSFITEYSLQFHREYYKPIRHIQVKQQKHLKDEVGTSSES